MTPDTPDLDTLLDATGGTALAEGGCPDELELAAYLDQTASTASREEVEAHLAACPTCREVVVETRAWLDEVPAEDAGAPVPHGAGAGPPLPTRRRRSWRPLLAAAAVTLVATGLFVLSGTDESGTVPDSGFETFVADDERPVVRAEDEARIELLVPSFTEVGSPRPTLRWRMPSTFDPGDVAGVRVLVLDAEERPVGREDLRPEGLRTVATPDGPATEADFPSDLPDLEPGGLYAWRVDVQNGDGRWWSSGFAPFRIAAR